MESLMLFAEMNFGENFTEFSSRMSGTDLALYAGAAIVVYLVFKKKIDPLKDKLLSWANTQKNAAVAKVTEFNPVVSATGEVKPIAKPDGESEDVLFFNLIESWKKTRNLAVKSKCAEAVEKADEMFPLLGVQNCKDKKED